MSQLTAEFEIVLTSIFNNPKEVESWVTHQTTLAIKEWTIENGHLYLKPIEPLNDKDLVRVLQHLEVVFDVTVKYTTKLL